MKKEGQNIFWVDAVKAVCMILVYFAHAEIYTNYTVNSINNVLRPIYVNAFFFVSGYLLFRKQWSDAILGLSVKVYIGPNGGANLNK